MLASTLCHSTIPDVPAALGDMPVGMDGGVGGGGGDDRGDGGGVGGGDGRGQGGWSGRRGWCGQRGEYGIGPNWRSAVLRSLLHRAIASGAEVRLGLLPRSSARGLSVYVDVIRGDGVRVTTVLEIGEVRVCCSVRFDH